MNTTDTGGAIDTCGARTLLDWFAGQALTAALTRDPTFKYALDKVACWSYEYAAAMLAEKRRLEDNGT